MLKMSLGLKEGKLERTKKVFFIYIITWKSNLTSHVFQYAIYLCSGKYNVVLRVMKFWIEREKKFLVVQPVQFFQNAAKENRSRFRKMWQILLLLSGASKTFSGVCLQIEGL